MTFIWLPYKMVSVTRHVTPPPRHIIKHTNLLGLRIDYSLAIDRFNLLSLCGWGLRCVRVNIATFFV